MHKTLSCIALAALLGACATSTPPPPPELDLPAPTAGNLKLDQWWTAFGDPTLDSLVAEALGNNLDLKAAITRVQYGRALVLAAQGDQYPTVDLTAGASRYRSTQVGTNPLPFGYSPLTTDLTLGLQASYEADLWAKYRNSTAAAQADLLATEYAREVIRTMVAADTVRGYFNLLAADAQLQLLLDTLKSRDETVVLQKDRYEGGVIGEYDLRTAEADRAAVAGDVAVARRARSEFESALAVLLGRSPKEVFAPRIDRNVELVILLGVPTLPSGVPTDMLARRPDVRQAAAQLAAANLRIDVARADYYPSISLTGSYGTEAGLLKDMFTGPGVVWSIAAQLMQPLLNFKKIEANVEAQTARRDELVYRYTQTVQGAFRDAHDALSANDTTREALAAENDRRVKLQQALEYSDIRYRAGYSPYLEVLDAQRQLLLAQTLEIVAARNVRLALVDFAKAAGGGWEFQADVAQP